MFFKGLITIPRADLPGCDHPDDNFSVSNFLFPKSGYNYQNPDLVTFLNGYHESFSLLADRIMKGEAFTDLGTFAGDVLGSSRVLVIPSGGLKGLKNSLIFKALLNEFVKNGGVLFVFGQQQGDDFTALPTPDGNPLRGYGWSEDQACLWNVVYLDTYHQVLASVATQYASVNVDGYFTSYPANSTTLLRRASNDLPAMLMYEHGLGRVIISSFYSDWGFARSQATNDEIAIIRDVISWGKQPANLPEFRPGTLASVSLNVDNSTTTDAARVKLALYNPDRTELLLEQTLDIPVATGQSATTSISYQIPDTATLGIYHIDYILFDAQGNTVQTQSEADSGRFAVSNPAKQVNVKKDILFSVSTTSQDVFYQDTFDYTFHIFNNSAQPRNLTVINYFRHTKRSHVWQISANSNGETVITGFDPFIDLSMFETMVSYLYDENGVEIGRYELSFKGLYPSVKTTVKTDKAAYGQSEIVQLSITLENSSNAALTSSLKIQVVDPANNTVFATTRNLIIDANGMNTDNLSFPLPQIVQRGSYTVIVQGYDQKGSRIGGIATAFEIPYSETTITSSLPAYYTAGTNAASFNLANVGRIPIAAGTFELNLKDPDGIVVAALSQPFALDFGQSRLLNTPIVIPQPKFGTYSIGYKASDETKVGNSVTIPLSNTVTIDFTQDSLKSRIREVAGAAVSLTNTGKFVMENALLTFSVPDVNFTDTRSVTINVGQKQEFSYQFPVPATLGEGSHVINITLTLPSGSTVVKTASFFVTPAILTTDYSGASNLAPGDLISLTVENSGGVDADYVTDKLTLTDATGKVFFEGSASGSLLAGEKKPLTTFSVPSQATTGPVVLDVIVKNVQTGSLFSLSKNLTINGLEAGLSTRTDKAAYLLTEPITAFSSIINGALAIEGGALDLTVTKYGVPGEDGFRLFLPQAGWAPFTNSPSDVTVSPDGSIYVADSGQGTGLVRKFDRNMSYIGVVGQYGLESGQYYNPSAVAAGPDGSMYVASNTRCRILKYDRDGRLLVQKGEYCTSSSNLNDGQFNSPSGIAVAADGSVYVADMYGIPIQKFDSNLNFISKWGSNGSGNGQFHYASGVAVGLDGSIYVADSYNHRIQKFDGNGNFIATWGGYGTGDGQFKYPSGVTVASDGTVFVVDSRNNRIQKFNANGTFIEKIGSQGSGDGQFYAPTGIAVSVDGSVYVADSGNKRLLKLDNSLQLVAKLETLGSDDGHFNGPSSIALGPDGSKYVADTNNHRIQKFDGNGNFILKWGSYGIGDGQFNYPGGIAVGPDGSVYVADSGNNRIQKFDPNGNFASKWGSRQYASSNGQFNQLKKISVSSDGFVYVLDANAIQKFDSSGTYIGRRQGGGNDIASAHDGSLYLSANYIYKLDNSLNLISQFSGSYIGAIAEGANGSIYVANNWYGRVDKYDANGTFIASFNSDVYNPRGIAVAADGAIFVADTVRHRIQIMSVSRDSESLFKTTQPVSQAASSTQDYSANIGLLTKPGKMYLAAELKNSLGQLVAKAEYPFYVLQGTTLLSASTDKKVYRPGETVTITGEVQNLAALNVVGVSLTLAQKIAADSQNLFTATIDVPANGKYPFSVTFTAGAAGVYKLTGKAVQNTTTLVEIADQYEVAAAKVSAILTAPDVAGNDPFTINITLKNEGKIPATVTLTPSFAELLTDSVIPVGETRLIQFSRQITADTTDTFVFSGDLSQTISKTVKYGLAATLSLASQTLYPEGKIAIPVTVTNSGLLDSQFSIDYQVSQGANLVSQQTKSHFLTKGTNSTDTLTFDLLEGSYQLAATSQKPAAAATTTFQVRKETKADLTLAVGTQTDNLLPATVTLANLGYYSIEGSIRVSLIDADSTTAWTAAQDVNLPQTPNPSPQSLSFPINLATLKPGNYAVKAELLDGGNRQLAARTAPFTLSGPTFVISQLPQYRIIPSGGSSDFTFKVKNSGNQEGAFDLAFKADDLTNVTRSEWLKPGEEKELTFALQTADDLEEKDYFAAYTLKKQGSGTGEQGTVKYHLQGINLAVTASLDKQSYNTGDSATVTLTVTQKDAGAALNLFARVNYNDYNEKQSFTLSDSQTLVFNVPLTKITGEKLFYGIYAESGRSIHLNTLYIYQTDGALSIATDKQVYNPGETVTAAISGSATGELILAGPGDFTATFAYSGADTRSFVLPATMTSGTYTLKAQLTTQNSELITASHPFDVAGIQVKVKEALLDKTKYSATDAMQLSLNIESNTDLPATLKTWVLDPTGNPTFAGSSNVVLTTTQPVLIKLDASLVTSSAGIHRLLYGIYSDNLLLSSGSEAFDVGSTALLGLSTDLNDYPTNVAPVVVKADLFGTNLANIEFSLDGKRVKNDLILLESFFTYIFTLSPETLIPGAHKLNAVLTSDGLTSSREINFNYGSSLPDLTVQLTNAEVIGSTAKLTATVINQGKTAVGASSAALYDSDPANGGQQLAVLNVPSISAGSSVTLPYDWNVLGKSGDHTLYVQVDPENLVAEFVEANNSAIQSVSIPNLTLGVSTIGASFKANSDVGIVVDLANLSSAPYLDLTLKQAITGPVGVVGSSEAAVASLAPAAELSVGNNWNTATNPPGDYRVDSSLIGGGNSLASGSATFAVEATPSLTGTMSLSSAELIQGSKLTIDYILANNGNIDLSGGEAKVEIVETNPGTTAQTLTQPFAQLNVLQSLTQTLAIDKLDVPPGDYVVKLTALAGGGIFPIDEKTLKVLPPLEVIKQLSTAPRLLVFIGKEENENDNELVYAETTIRLALDGMGVYYSIVRDEMGVRSGLRSGLFNSYLLAGRKPLADHLDEELAERINSGDGLILANYGPVEDGKFRDVAGIESAGSLPANSRLLNLLESPIGHSGSYTVTSKIEKLSVSSTAQVAASVVDKGQSHPALVLHPYGEGKVVVFAFDPDVALLQGAVGYVAPTRVDPIPVAPLPVELTVRSLGAPFDLKVTETVDTGLPILSTWPLGTIDQQTITWKQSLGSNGTAKFSYLTGLPEESGIFTLSSEISYLRNGSYEIYKSYPLTVKPDKGLVALKTDILVNLQSLAVTVKDAAILNKIVGTYADITNKAVFTEKQADEAIKELLSLTEELRNLQVDTTSVRLDLDKLLRIYGRKWSSLQY